MSYNDELDTIFEENELDRTAFNCNFNGDYKSFLYEKKYNELIDKVSKVVDKLALPYNEFSYAFVLNYLINEKELTHKISKEDENIYFLGAKAFDKNSSCRHKSKLFDDVFKKIGIDSYVFVCQAYDGVNINEIDASLFGNGNHVVNNIKYNNVDYLFDLHNFGSVYNFIGPITAEYNKNYKSSLSIYYVFKPEMSYIFNKESVDDVKDRILSFDRSSKSPIISVEELDDIERRTLRRIDWKYGKVKRLERDFNND